MGDVLFLFCRQCVISQVFTEHLGPTQQRGKSPGGHHEERALHPQDTYSLTGGGGFVSHVAIDYFSSSVHSSLTSNQITEE